MSLSEKQQRFMRCVGWLLRHIDNLGYGVTLGDGYRDPRVHGTFGEKGSYAASKSVHKKRLAIDLNLFVDSEYITDGDHPVYKMLGEFWEGLDASARWGGRFDDANHFSFEHDGVK